MKPIPVAVIGGYLGAGKTTLLNALLRDANGLRYAVLVNDFGSVNIDGELVASAGTQAIELTNGCICCTIGGDLILALKELLTRDAVPERIVIEASGVSDPRAVARTAACHPALHVQGTIVVADAETIVDRADDKYVGGLVRRQLGAGDAIILNKIDLIGEDRLAVVRQWLSDSNPGVPVFESSIDAGFPAEILFDSDFGGLREERAEPRGAAVATFTSVTYRSAHPFDRARFLEAVRGMIPATVRAKGIVYFADDPETRCIFQRSGERWSVEPFASAELQRESKIVVIAVTERKPQLEDMLQALHRAAQVTISRRDGYFITLKCVEQAAQRTASVELAMLAANMFVEDGQACDPAYPYDWSDLWGAGNVKSEEEAFEVARRFMYFEIRGTDEPQASDFLRDLEEQTAAKKDVSAIWLAWIDAARAPVDLAPPSPWISVENASADNDITTYTHIFSPTKAQVFCERVAASARNILRQAFHNISVRADPSGYTDSLCVIHYGAMDADMRLRANLSLTVGVNASIDPQSHLYHLKARLECWYDGRVVLETSDIVRGNVFGAGEPGIDERSLLGALDSVKTGE